VQAYADANDKVLAYSVTTRTSDFQPTFGWCGLGNVTLGKTTFADVAQFSESGGPIIAAYANYALHDGTRYSEFYGRVGACNYVNYVMTANSSGLPDAAPDDYTLDGLVPNSGVATFGAGLADVPPLPGQVGPGMEIPGAPQSDGRPLDYFTQTFIPDRSNLFVNTITVTAPNFDFFKDHPEFVVTGTAPFGPRQQELPVGSSPTGSATPSQSQSTHPTAATQPTTASSDGPVGSPGTALAITDSFNLGPGTTRVIFDKSFDVNYSSMQAKLVADPAHPDYTIGTAGIIDITATHSDGTTSLYSHDFGSCFDEHFIPGFNIDSVLLPGVNTLHIVIRDVCSNPSDGHFFGSSALWISFL